MRTQTLSPLFEALAQVAASNPSGPALLARDFSMMSHAALQESVAEGAGMLREHGIGPGSRVALVLRQGPDMATALLTVTSTATAVPLHPEQTEVEFARVFEDLQVSAVVLGDDNHAAARRAAVAAGMTVLELGTIEGHVAARGFTRTFHATQKARIFGQDDANDVVMILQTSGTTARPKYVPVTGSGLVERARNSARYFQLGTTDRCLNLMSLAHGHGIFDGLLAPLISGGSTMCAPAFRTEDFFDLLDRTAPTWLTAGFTIHKAILAAASKQLRYPSCPSLRLIRSGSGALDPKVADGLERIFRVPVVVTYALTEAGVVAASSVNEFGSSDPKVGPWLKDNVGIIDGDGTLLPPGVEGEIVVRGDNVSTIYENEHHDARVANGWLKTGDLGILDAEGELSITGRTNEIINRGGQKISPTEVDQVLLQHPDVAEVLTFPVPHRTLGEEVAAAIVPVAGSLPSEAALTTFMQKSLARFKIPRRILLVDQLPCGPTGKPRRSDAATSLELTQFLGKPPPVESLTPLEAQVLDIWALVLGHRDIGLDDDFFLVGGDSLQAVELFTAIEEHLGHVLPEATVLEANTVRAMTRTIANEDPAGSLVAFRSSGSRPPLFLAHHGGGHVLGYRTLANLLDPDQPVFAFQAVGLDGSSDPLGSIEEMAARYVEELRRIQPRGPYQVGGFSFGGRVAYVMAQMLREAGEDVHLLALIDSYSFHGTRFVPTERRVERQIRKFFALPLRQRWHWIVEGVLRNLKGVLRSRILVPLYRTTYWFYRRRSRPLPRFLRQAKLANSMAGLAYRAKPYQGDAVLFRGYLPPNMHSDMYESWRRLVQGRLDVVDLPGTHEEVLLEPIVRIVAEQLETRLMQRVDSGF